jgi:multidrug resistance efflux pump
MLPSRFAALAKGTPMKRRIALFAGVLLIVAGGVCYVLLSRAPKVVITGMVTTDSIIISSEIQGRVQQLLVKQGDAVKRGELVATIQPQEWKADMTFYVNTERQWEAQVTQAAADLKFQEAQTSSQIRQAEANLASAQAVVLQAEADFENANLTFKRQDDLHRQGVESAQSFDQARTGLEAAKAHVESLRKQALAAEAAVALAKANAEQVAVRRAALEATQSQLAAAAAQKQRAKVRLDYTEIRAPIDGIVDVRAALAGEVVTPAQAIVTLINPDDLWVRADVEEGLIDRIRLGEKLPVRFPSGIVREGTVFYRGVDADYATQRDVSRTKRDIKTFEVRLRCDNADRRLAVGMSAYVNLPPK